MWHLFDIAVACDALEGGMGRRFQRSRVEARGCSGLALPDTRAGIMAAGAVLGMQLGRLPAAEAGGQEGRNGSEPKEVQSRHGAVFFNNSVDLGCK
jgi:hypothetical protein